MYEKKRVCVEDEVFILSQIANAGEYESIAPRCCLILQRIFFDINTNMASELLRSLLCVNYNITVYIYASALWIPHAPLISNLYILM